MLLSILIIYGLAIFLAGFAIGVLFERTLHKYATRHAQGGGRDD